MSSKNNDFFEDPENFLLSINLKSIDQTINECNINIKADLIVDQNVLFISLFKKYNFY